MSTTANEFGRYFRSRRTSLGLNLSEFCRRNGFDKGNISRLERGLIPPPESPDLLKAYAQTLQLQQDSEDWKSFIRHAEIARGKIPSAVSDKPVAAVEAVFRQFDKRLHDSWVKARDLEQWSATREAQAELPTLIRKLIYASTEQPANSTEPPTRIEVPAIDRHGWDAVVDVRTKSFFVPHGPSGWEISVEQRPAQKAERDFNARKSGPLGLPPSEVTFVFVTSWKWDGKQKWRDEKRKLGKWKSVEVYDSSDLEAWLEIAPGVDAWIAERLGRCPPGVVSIDDYWESLSRLCEPRLKPDVFLASRAKTAKELRAFLLGPPGVMTVESRSPIEALDFAAAYLAVSKPDGAEFAMEEDDRIQVQSRSVVVKDRAQWDGLSRASGQLNLLPIPSLSLTPEELNAAVSRGHRILVAATQFSNHRLQPVMLPRPSRYDLENALCKSGIDKETAVKAARAAGGSLSILKRHLSRIPDVQLPKWYSQNDLASFIPMLLVGAWDDANEVDRSILSRLSGRPYGELQNIANRLLQVEDAPLMRVENRWRLVSPEDSWSLVGPYITDNLLTSFEIIAMDVLSWQDESIDMSSDERIRYSLMGKSDKRASGNLRRGIAETAAILGSGFGPVEKLAGSQERAAKIVHAVLQQTTWQKWATLDSLLPLLAEAAPNEFLASIDADLKRNQPELARLLSDSGNDHPLMSRCKHAGLLWALETLAWSPDLLPRVCTILGRLDEVDQGGMWGNRPAASLYEILLAWHPQTAAGVDKRIAILKSLADRTPAVAWKLMLAMLPENVSTADLTHRPIWRDWMSTWQDGTSDADYWKQVNAAAELIVRLVGNDPTRWTKLLDDLQSIPEPYRAQLTDLLQSLPVEEINYEERRRLSQHLRKTIQHHRDFADTQWALPAPTVDALEQALPRLLPAGICEQYVWLFVEWPKLEGYRDKYREEETEIARLRANAVCDIVNQEGFNGVLNLANIVESPGAVGVALARTSCVADSEILPDLLRSSNDKHQRLARTYARVRICDAGWEWVHSLPLEKWSAPDAVAFLCQADFDSQTWDFAKNLGEEIYSQYWKSVPDSGIVRLDQQQLEFACQKMIEADRPESAITILYGVTFQEVNVSPSIAMDALTACLKWKQSNPDLQLLDDTLRIIKQLFVWLQNTIPYNQDEPTRRLAQLEWEFLALLDGYGTYPATPATLVRILSDDPKFFAQLIALVFPSNDEQASNTEPTEKQKEKALKARHGYRLLMNWDRIPGAQSNDLIAEEQLLKWLESARALCRKSGHLEVADSKIGEMLARCLPPKDENTEWPCEAIRDAIEEANSDDLDRGFYIGICNSRGVTFRSPFDGGDLERKEADKYRRWAALCDVDWPRTAASLRSVAASYESQALHEDSLAAERAQERH